MGVESPQSEGNGQWSKKPDGSITFKPDDNPVEPSVHPFTEATGLEFEPREHPLPTTALDRIKKDGEEQEEWDRYARNVDRMKKPKNELK